MLQVLSRELPQNEDSNAIAGEFVRLLQDIRTVLTPILGVRGVAALLQRSLLLAALKHPWLADQQSGPDAIDEPALRTSLIARDGQSARVAALCVFASLHAVLTSLVGESLTERLFETMWTTPTSGPAAQEFQP